MLKIYTAGSFGYAQDLIASHRLRTRVFSEVMGWDVSVKEGGLEIDQFDRPDTVYVNVYDKKAQLVGCCRILRCDKPYMVKDIWPHYLKTIDIPDAHNIAELSRFAVLTDEDNHKDRSNTVSEVTVKLFYGVTLYCMMSRVPHIYALHDIRVQKLVRKIGCIPTQLSHYEKIDGIPCSVGGYNTDIHMQKNLASHLGGELPHIEYADDVTSHFISNTAEAANHQGDKECIG